VKPGRRGTEREIAPVRGDATNGKGRRIIKSPSKGIMHGKVPYSASVRHTEATLRSPLPVAKGIKQQTPGFLRESALGIEAVWSRP